MLLDSGDHGVQVDRVRVADVYDFVRQLQLGCPDNARDDVVDVGIIPGSRAVAKDGDWLTAQNFLRELPDGKVLAVVLGHKP